jgi:EAL domain-containing protein (putative c-di-GMP-specific phosphodiesterase class I)/GGDEF domain-containing protein
MNIMNVKNKKLLKKINIWIYLVPFLLITIFFSVRSYYSVQQKIAVSNEHFIEDAADAARNYSYTLNKTAEAEKIINGLLDAKLTEAGRTVMLANGVFTQAIAKKFAKTLNVDQICVYDDSGTITYSNVDSYVGWKAEEGHPVYEFMKSGRDESIDEIRADTVSGEYFKYAYYKLPSGDFVQIGISAGDVIKFSGSFDTGRLLDDLNEDPYIDEISLVGMDGVIVNSTKHELKGTLISIPEVNASINEGREISYIDRSSQGKVLYNSIIPLRDDGKVTGALFVSSEQKAVSYIAAEELRSSIWQYFTIILGSGGIVLMIYRNNRNYIKLAYYDPNTGLPNRESLKYFLESLSKEKKWSGAIMMLNFSYLTNLSMLYGSDFTEKVFAEITLKVKEAFKNDGTVFRTTKDRMVIFYKAADTVDQNPSGLERMMELFKNETFSDQNISMPVEIGIAELAEEEDPDSLLKKALIAVNRTKADGSIVYQYFNSEMEAAVEREDLIEKDLVQAIKDEEAGRDGSIYAVFQPQVDPATDKLTGFEALARMKSDILGDISPAEFIGVAERKRLITPLTRLILKKVSIFVRRMREGSEKKVRIAVNISGADLMRSDFIEDITSLIDSLGIEKSDLEFEITESVILDDFAMANEKLGILRDRGILISLDDFGTGFSSLSRLRELNVDIVKIDKLFVDNILIKKRETLILSEIISMVHKQGLRTVAEGVETEEQKTFLAEAGCDVIQGYYYSRPLQPSAALELFLKRNKDFERAVTTQHTAVQAKTY